MKNLAIVPARGGSKRLPRKNILPLDGKPLILWTLEAAVKSCVFDTIIVSTDDEEIAEIADIEGVDVVMRPDHLSQDVSTTDEVCVHVLDELEAVGKSFDSVSCLYATAPLRDSDDIKAVVELVSTGHYSKALAVTEYIYPFHQAMRVTGNGGLIPLFPDQILKRRSDVPKTYVGNGSTYTALVSEYRRTKDFVTGDVGFHFMPEWKSTDIDEKIHFDLVTLLYQSYVDKR